MKRKRPKPRHNPGNHCPTPEEIAAACMAIRLEWPEAEELRRREADQYEPLTVTRCKIGDSVREPRE